MESPEETLEVPRPPGSPRGSGGGDASAGGGDGDASGGGDASAVLPYGCPCSCI